MERKGGGVSRKCFLTTCGTMGGVIVAVLVDGVFGKEEKAPAAFSVTPTAVPSANNEEREKILAGIGPSEDRGYRVITVSEKSSYKIVTRKSLVSEGSAEMENRLIGKKSWLRPVNAPVINVPFGGYNEPGRQPHHTGIDFQVGLNTKVKSVDQGVIHFFGWWPVGSEPHGHGNTLWIYHGVGDDGRPVYSVYAHLNGLFADTTVGKVVEKGEEVALSGATGFGDGPHLHFAVARQWAEFSLTWSEVNNPWENPLDYFSA